MTKKQVEIVNKTGLHARPASDFVLEAKRLRFAGKTEYR